MAGSTVQIQDKLLQIKASVVPLTADPTKNGLVICNADGSTVGVVAWGDITGTLSNQTDLQTALDTVDGNAFFYALAFG